MTGTVSSMAAEALKALVAEAPLSLRARGACMSPLLADAAMIRVGKARFYWPGDVIIVHAPDGRFLAHRLLGVYRKDRVWRWLTQGDNAHWPDAAVTKDRIVGKLCGGECSPQLIEPPLAHRWYALMRFARFIAARVLRRAAALSPAKFKRLRGEMFKTL